MEDNKNKQLILKGKSIAYIDWANVYGWKKSLKKEINPEKKLNGYIKKSSPRLLEGRD